MHFFWIIIGFLVFYIFLVYVASRFVVPFMGWAGFKPATDVPPELQPVIQDLENKTFDQYTYLQAVFDLIMQKNFKQWNHTRFQAAIRLPRAFVKDLSEIWNTQDFIYCTGMNYLAAALLVNGKYFKPQDIKVRHVFVNFFIHQYLQVRVGEKWVDFDPAGTGIRGKPLGTHLAGFG
ncbi:MAG: hypothetical protein KGJ93_01030 [Patescibacteria group bacterium]|nr:hypothetical protein [Patescibacteria group bacterium]